MCISCRLQAASVLLEHQPSRLFPGLLTNFSTVINVATSQLLRRRPDLEAHLAHIKLSILENHSRFPFHLMVPSEH